MDLFQIVSEVIDMRSFSNLWYWIFLAVYWATASHWVLGVPHDMVQRARRQGGQPMEDVRELARINSARILYYIRMSGQWLVAILCFILSTLATFGFYFGNEFAQAVFLLTLPMAIVGVINAMIARQVEQTAPVGKELTRILTSYRMAIQAIGMVAIFLTAIWGMYQNLRLGPLG